MILNQLEEFPLADIAKFELFVVDVAHVLGIVEHAMWITTGAHAHELGYYLKRFLI